MYDYPTLTASKQPEHADFAMGVANQMLDRYSPMEIAEIFAFLKTRITEEFSMRNAEAEKRIALTKEMLSKI